MQYTRAVRVGLILLTVLPLQGCSKGTRRAQFGIAARCRRSRLSGQAGPGVEELRGSRDQFANDQEALPASLYKLFITEPFTTSAPIAPFPEKMIVTSQAS